jgi:hypothetical protein
VLWESGFCVRGYVGDIGSGGGGDSQLIRVSAPPSALVR